MYLMLDTLGPRGLPDFTLRLNQVIDRHSWIDDDGSRRRFENNRQIADAITKAGEPISRAYVSMLRAGQQSNPSARLISALCAVFDVPPAFWFDRETADQVCMTTLLGLGINP